MAEDRYAARDALELIEVEYDVLPPVIDARKALDADVPVIRDEIEGRTDNHIFDWDMGDRAETEAIYDADVVVSEMVYPRVHPAPMETCGAIADFDAIDGKLTLYETAQAPHAHRTLFAIVAGIPEHKIRVISPDIGGGFGNKVGIYPGYILAVVGSIVTGRPVKWVEDRSENLMSTSSPGTTSCRARSRPPRTARSSRCAPTSWPITARSTPPPSPPSIPPVSSPSSRAATTSRPPTAASPESTRTRHRAGVAYACSFRVTEAVYLVERMVDILARKLEMDPAELRLKNFIKPEQFPYANKTGWVYDSGNYEPAMRLSMQLAGYDELRREQREKRERGEMMGIGVSFFTETVGAGPRKRFDIVGLGMADGAELRVHPTGKAVVRLSVQSQGQGHETTFAQIVAEELRIPPEDIDVVHGDTDQTPFGLGTYGSRSTPVSGGAVALVARKVREKAKLIAAAMLETRPDDLEWEKGRWFVKGDPTAGKPSRDRARPPTARSTLPEGVDGNLDAEVTYDPPNLTFPLRRLHLRGRRRSGHRAR